MVYSDKISFPSFPTVFIVNLTVSLSHTINYNDMVYNDVGVAHPEKNDKTLFGLTKFKFRRTKEQSQIIRELLPEDMIKKIQSAIDEKSQTLEYIPRFQQYLSN